MGASPAHSADLLYSKFKMFFGESFSQATALAERFDGDYNKCCDHIKQPAGGAAVGTAAQEHAASLAAKCVEL